MPEDPQSFGEGLWFILTQAVENFLPELARAASVCFELIGIAMLVAIMEVFSESAGKTVHLAATVMIGIMLLDPAHSLMGLGIDTVTQLKEYNQLLIPVMTAALAAQGSVTASASLYTVTTFFTAFLSAVLTRLVIPMLYVYLCLGLLSAAVGNELLTNMHKFIKWLITWSLKIILYVFIGFISITGVVSGAADASSVKAVRLTISAMVPVVGGILSDASESILVSVGLMKSATGIYGILAMICVFIGPFMKIGCQYIMLKVTAALCSVFSAKQECELIKSFSGGMGLLLASTGTVCLILLIGVVSFMKGVS